MSFKVVQTPVLTDFVHPGQTFEGGISGSPGVEAHGAYAFCALACLSIIGPPEETIARYEISWMITVTIKWRDADCLEDAWICPSFYHGYQLGRMLRREDSPEEQTSWLMDVIAIGSAGAGHYCSLQ
jgi:hypothetical protein